MAMPIQLLDTVALVCDLPEHGLTAGEVGAVVEVLSETIFEVEFIDESGQVFNDGNDLTYAWFATRSRHYGHSVTFISQRAMQIPRTMRDQCSRLYLFTSSRYDGKLHAEEWNKDELETCTSLPKMHFFIADREKELRYMKIVN